MNSVISTVLLSTEMGLFERLSYGAQVFVVGMLTVFSALAILWGVMVLFKIFMYDLPQKKAHKKAAAELEAAAPQSEAAPDITDDNDSSAADDDAQLIAVITAAIEAYSGDTGSALPFRVVSYKRVRGANGWSGADENESI